MNQGWIKCENESDLPKQKGRYWLTVKDLHQKKPVTVAACRSEYGFVRFPEGGPIAPRTITAYMPFTVPPPFKESPKAKITLAEKFEFAERHTE